VNGNKLRQIFYPYPSSKSDDAPGLNDEDRSLLPFPHLRCLLLGACLWLHFEFTISASVIYEHFCMPYSCRSIAPYHCVLLHASISQSVESLSFNILKRNCEELRYCLNSPFRKYGNPQKKFLTKVFWGTQVEIKYQTGPQ